MNLRRAAIAIAIFSSCSDEPMMMMPPDPTITLDALCGELAKADCDRLSRCNLTAAPFDMDRCLFRQATVRCEPYRAAIQKSVGTGELTFFELAARACRDHLGALDCMHTEDVNWFAEPECIAMVGGNAPEGAPCTFPFSCSAADNACLTTADCPGTCQKLRTNNTACSFREPCAEGFFCATPAMRCHTRVALGAPCEISVAGNACAESSFCDMSQPGQAVCAQSRGRNTGCTSPYECAAGLTCAGGLCSGGFEGDTCRASTDCNGLLRCARGKCATAKGNGEMCMDSSECREGFACAANMMCTPRPVIGGECGAEVPCYLSRCADGTCAEAIADGAACMADTDCLPGRVCFEGFCNAGTINCTR